MSLGQYETTKIRRNNLVGPGTEKRKRTTKFKWIWIEQKAQKIDSSNFLKEDAMASKGKGAAWRWTLQPWQLQMAELNEERSHSRYKNSTSRNNMTLAKNVFPLSSGALI